MSSNTHYKVSILIPTYNRLNLFIDTMNSIIPQVVEKQIHVAIVDDGSTEKNYEYALELKKNYPFIEVVRHEKNLGLASAKNTLLKLAKGDYLLFFDSDDLLLPGAVEKILKIIDSGFVDVYVLNTYRQKGRKLKFKYFPCNMNGLELLKAFLDGKFSEALYLIKTEKAKQIHCNSSLRVKEDLAQKACYLLFYKVKVINEPFAIIRDNPQRLRNISDYYFTHAISAVDDLFNRLPQQYQVLKSYALGKTYLELAKMAYKNSLYHEAEKFLKEAKTVLPELNWDFKYLKLKIKLSLIKFVKLWKQ
jgi:glycosyltransferase involved in cell wall biosynthesis